ncbi:hypothetical protein PoB_006089400 [Plakobranchus ocellatus]|uniref:Uncharacterized protein n=1 Tax=Plakobranchus ocellatus TaxID=259542 RepID=A0AAV4CR98_9GAST|nr:hypothetical protein PoB_006089400 [Plakobranchus ocellatus]
MCDIGVPRTVPLIALLPVSAVCVSPPLAFDITPNPSGSGVGRCGTVVSESALRSAGTLLSRDELFTVTLTWWRAWKPETTLLWIGYTCTYKNQAAGFYGWLLFLLGLPTLCRVLESTTLLDKQAR